AGWRGEPGVPDEPQHRKQGEVTPALLDAMEYPYRVLRGTDDDAGDDVAWGVATAKERSAPVFLLVQKGTFASGARLPGDEPSVAMAREEAIEAIVEALGPGVAVVATTGMVDRARYRLGPARAPGGVPRRRRRDVDAPRRGRGQRAARTRELRARHVEQRRARFGG